jgi:hypothetical protein
MITTRFSRRSMHSLIVLWGNWVMRNGTTEITMTKRTQDAGSAWRAVRLCEIASWF